MEHWAAARHCNEGISVRICETFDCGFITVLSGLLSARICK